VFIPNKRSREIFKQLLTIGVPVVEVRPDDSVICDGKADKKLIDLLIAAYKKGPGPEIDALKEYLGGISDPRWIALAASMKQVRQKDQQEEYRKSCSPLWYQAMSEATFTEYPAGSGKYIMRFPQSALNKLKIAMDSVKAQLPDEDVS
jgi:hypothetical protein